MERGWRADSTSCHECICPPEDWGMHTDTVSSTKPFRCHSHIRLFPALTVMTNRENAYCQHWQGSVCSGTGLCLYGREVCVLFFLKLVGEYYGSYPRNQCRLLVTFPIWFWETGHWSVVFPKEQNKVYSLSCIPLFAQDWFNYLDLLWIVGVFFLLFL